MTLFSLHSWRASWHDLWHIPAAIVLLCSASGCAMMTPVQAWEKGTLARPEMTIQGNAALAGKFSEHIYASRESASGGAGVGGGGCGCN